jgi:hypothetical protein
VVSDRHRHRDRDRDGAGAPLALNNRHTFVGHRLLDPQQVWRRGFTEAAVNLAIASALTEWLRLRSAPSSIHWWTPICAIASSYCGGLGGASGQAGRRGPLQWNDQGPESVSSAVCMKRLGCLADVPRRSTRIVDGSCHRTVAFMATEENALVWLFATMPLVVASNALKWSVA